jgi:hypothetical protein
MFLEVVYAIRQELLCLDVEGKMWLVPHLLLLLVLLLLRLQCLVAPVDP